MKALLIAILFSLLLASCGGDPAGDPAQIVVDYLQAKVQADENGIRRLLCSEMESLLLQEANSFASIDARLEAPECRRDGEVVRCDGEIVAIYGTEAVSFPLSSYRVVAEAGEWKWCGEAP